MTNLFPFRQTAISAAIRTLRIPARPLETAQVDQKQMDTTQTIAAPEKMPHSAWAEALECFDDTPVALPVFTGSPKEEQAALVKTIGTRLREARELCNMSQQRAAEALGYSNSSKLAKIEGATDTNSVPLPVIMRAARLYDVSIDFLFGAADDWEPGVERDVTHWLLRAWESARRRDLEHLAQLYRRVRVVSQCVLDMVGAAGAVHGALQIVREKNEAFDDLLAGNRLLVAVERQTEAARKAESGMKRFRAELVSGELR